MILDVVSEMNKIFKTLMVVESQSMCYYNECKYVLLIIYTNILSELEPIHWENYEFSAVDLMNMR